MWHNIFIENLNLSNSNNTIICINELINEGK